MKASDGGELRAPVSNSAWNHLCVTWTRLTGYVSVYVNATLVHEKHQPILTDFMNDGAIIRLGNILL